jgi:hypothetical protein
MTGHADLGHDPHAVVTCVESSVDLHGCSGRCARRSGRRRVHGRCSISDRNAGRGSPSRRVDPLRVEAEPRQPTSRKPVDGSLPVVRGGRQPTRRGQLESCSITLGFTTTFPNEIIELIVGERAGEADDFILLHVARHSSEARHVGLEAEVTVGLGVKSVRARHAIDPDGV